MNQLVSIVIPIYNVEKYLERCLNSVMNQTYKCIEVLLIDDGSTDCSLEICNAYAKRDSRFKVYHKENGGLSDARNYGIDRAIGEWLYFLDSDDWISDNTISDLVEVSIKNECQIAMGSCNFCHSVDEFAMSKTSNEVIFYNNEEALYEMTTGLKFVFYAWNRLYKRELFKEIRFPVGKLYEDMFTTYKVIDLAKKIAYVPQAKYAYFQRNDSIANRKYSSNQLDWYEGLVKYRNYCNEKHQELFEVVNNLMVFTCISLMNKMISSKNEYESYEKEYNLMVSEIKKCYKEYILSRKPGLAVNLKYKLSATLIMISKDFYRKLYCLVFK